MFWNLFCVGCGGFVGAIARYSISTWVQRAFPRFLPAGTLLVNLIGCFCIGGLMVLAVERKSLPPQLQLILATGLLGALTTFSTFGYETFALLRNGDVRLAFLNIGANMLLGMLAVWLGHVIGEKVF